MDITDTYVKLQYPNEYFGVIWHFLSQQNKVYKIV